MRWGWVFLLFFGNLLSAQGIYLSRYTPGQYLTDDQHRVVLRNDAPTPADIGGYLLVTRDYSIRIPDGVSIPGRTDLVIAKAAGPGVHLALAQNRDFLIRFQVLEHQGNYVALFNASGQMVDGLYYSPVKSVPFLPDRDTTILHTGQRLPFYLPPEQAAPWSFVQATDAAGNSFVREGGSWRLLTTEQEVLTSYRDLRLGFREDIVTIKWWMAALEGAGPQVVERSTDRDHFVPLDTLEPVISGAEYREYTVYDHQAEPDRQYNYRIRSLDAGGGFSATQTVQTREGLEEFSMEVYTVRVPGGEQLRLRFSSRYSQVVRIKLFNDDWEEEAILFNDYVFAGSPNLLRLSRPLQAGRRYLIMATTETGRFSREISVDR